MSELDKDMYNYWKEKAFHYKEERNALMLLCVAMFILWTALTIKAW